MTQNIQQAAAKLIRRSESRNPFRIAREIGREVVFRDIGKLKGMYSYIKRNRFIIINNELNDDTKNIVCAHEIGHDQLHRYLAKESWLQEFMLYDMTARPEYEANVFASHILLDENEIFEMINYDYDIFQIAGKLMTDVNLLLIKLGEMNKQGFDFNMTYIPRGNFLGK